MMKEHIQEMREKIREDLSHAHSGAELKEFFSTYLGRNGSISALMKELGKLSKEERPAAGKLINEFRDEVLASFKKSEEEIAQKELADKYQSERVDITMPAVKRTPGALNPINIVRTQLIDLFAGMGFVYYEGPEIEDDYHNFTALNTPKDHPARDKQDTFYITEDLLLRTQTSGGQIRSMEEMKPPFKVLVAGRVFRCDDDATHSPMFHQMEGFIIDRHVSLSDLHGLLDKLAKSMFSPNTKTRFRPSYFPFTEPSVEVDISCCECGGKGCRLCKGTGWIEILGAGVVNRNVIRNGGLDPDEWTGLAFGAGLDRIAMLKYGINNIHILFDGDEEILSQFAN